MQEQDTIAWVSGIYFKNALETVLGSMFGAKGLSYMDTSIMSEMNKYAGMTQEEIDDIEIEKMIAEEDRYMNAMKFNGMQSIGDLVTREK